MRKTSQTAQDIFKAEKSKADRQRSRKQGFAKMKERDLGEKRLSNGVVIRWCVPQNWSEPIDVNGVEICTNTGNKIPDGYFMFDFSQVKNPSKILFNAEEFQRWLRWA